MKTIETIAELRAELRAARAVGNRIGFVPTMGYLHAGHLALVARARRHAEFIVTSIFVNPTQFAPTEDLATYPRDPGGDFRKLEESGCDILFLPSRDEIYPAGFASSVHVEGVTDLYEGAFRPSHFDGVATVVAKLFNIVAPDVAVFGQKDAQQIAVVRRMVADLNFAVEIAVIETVREADGLAMSSRNVYLTPADRAEAVSINRALQAAQAAIDGGASIADADARMRSVLSPAIVVDYADIVNADTFQPALSQAEPLLAVIAGRVGRTRLIDNMPLASRA